MSQNHRGFLVTNNKGISISKEDYRHMDNDKRYEFAKDCDMNGKTMLITWDLELYEELHGSIEVDTDRLRENSNKFFETSLKDYLNDSNKDWKV